MAYYTEVDEIQVEDRNEMPVCQKTTEIVPSFLRQEQVCVETRNKWKEMNPRKIYDVLSVHKVHKQKIRLNMLNK